MQIKIVDYLEKSKEAETALMRWLDERWIPYMFIDQKLETMSKAHRLSRLRRPDFIIPFGDFRIYADVGYKFRINDEISVSIEEVAQYFSLARVYGEKIWYVFSTEEYETWFWLPVASVPNHKIKKGEYGFFYLIHIPSDINIRTN